MQHHILNFLRVVTLSCYALTGGLIALPIYLLQAFSVIQMPEMVRLNLIEVLENCMMSFPADHLDLSRVKALLPLWRPLMYLVRGQVAPLLFLHLLSCHGICALLEQFHNLCHYPFILHTDGFLMLLCFAFFSKGKKVRIHVFFFI